VNEGSKHDRDAALAAIKTVAPDIAASWPADTRQHDRRPPHRPALR
jgi:hypothetical protein